MHETLSVTRHPNAQDLQAQAALVFRALGITKSEERFSSNYPPNEHYFLGHGLNASVVVCDADSPSKSHPYWLTIKEPVTWGGAVDTVSTDLETVISLLQSAGFQCTPGPD